jgi:hypothetical protein
MMYQVDEPPLKSPLQRELSSWDGGRIGLNESTSERSTTDDTFLHAKPTVSQKTVRFDYSEDIQEEDTEGIVKFDELPHGLVLNVWRLTGDGFEFYDMFEDFKKEIEKWK